jgi:hypothetical protein
MFWNAIIGPLKSYFIRKKVGSETWTFYKQDPDPDPELTEKSDPGPDP